MSNFLNCLFTLILASFAVLQLNDPDAYLWVFVYGCCALVPLAALMGRFYPALFWFCIVLCLVSVATSVPGGIEFLRHAKQTSLLSGMSPERPYVESARELYGALLAYTVLVACYFLQKRRISHTKT